MVAGTLKAGTILPNSVLLLGPDVGNGKFNQVGIKSIHYKRLPVNKVCPPFNWGQCCHRHCCCQHDI